MKISAIDPARASDAAGRRDTLAVPVQDLMQALSNGAVSADSRKLIADTLAAWGNIAARVVQQGADGEYVMDVAGARVTLPLPQARTPGSIVLLTTIGGGSVEFPLSPENSATFSETARLLARLSAATMDASTTDSPERIMTPALAASADKTDTLARGLDKAIRNSGLFYESHLAQWLDNRYSLADMRHEPQFQSRLNGANDIGPGGMPGEQPPIVAANLLPLVKQQLAAVETQTIPWNGMLWPGQSCEIEIQPDRSEGTLSADGRPVWITRVTLDLPRLGRVETLVALRDDKVALSVSSATATAASELTEEKASLELALAARGFQAEGLIVRKSAD